VRQAPRGQPQEHCELEPHEHDLDAASLADASQVQPDEEHEDSGRGDPSGPRTHSDDVALKPSFE